MVPGRRKLMEISDVANPTPAGAPVRIAQPSGASATNASVPAKKTPAPVCHQGLAGMANVVFPRLTSVTHSPVSTVIGGSGRRRSN